MEPRDEAGADRSGWPVRVGHLKDESSEDLSAVTTAADRVALVWTLTARMWELTGRPAPAYSRADVPVRVVRRA
jgi:hypothetical protein